MGMGKMKINQYIKIMESLPAQWRHHFETDRKVFRASKGPALTIESLYDPSNGLHYFVINHYGVHHELYIATRPGWNNLKIEVSTKKIALYNNDTFQLDHEINTRSLNISYSKKYSTRPVLLKLSYWLIYPRKRLFFILSSRKTVPGYILAT